MTRLLLVRHGETEMSRTRHLCGRTDEPLNLQGLHQIEILRDRLARTHLDAIYSSDLQRAWITAQAVASPHNIDISICPEMREMDFGQCEGLTFSQVELQCPEVARLWLSRSPALSYPGGESLDDFEQRVNSFSSRLQTHKASDTILLVAHLGSLRILVCHLLGIAREHWWQFQLDYTSISTVETNPSRIDPELDRRAMLICLNDTSHLNKAGDSSP